MYVICKIVLRILRRTGRGDKIMKRILGATGVVLVLAALTPAQAWANPQHERMKRCNAEAKTQALGGDARKAFMSTCLSGKHEAAAASAPGAAPALASGSAAGVSAAAPVAAPAMVPAAAPAVAPAAAATAASAAGAAAPALAVAPTAGSAQKVSSEDMARQKACNRAATEQSLRGAKRKAFIGECMSG
jgi:hypothetical protein